MPELCVSEANRIGKSGGRRPRSEKNRMSRNVAPFYKLHRNQVSSRFEPNKEPTEL